MAEQVTRNPYAREIPRLRWIFRHPRYLRYIAREVTCIFIGAYTVLLLFALARLAQGRESYEAFLRTLGTSAGIVFHIVVLAFALYHTVSWFNVTPKAMPIQRGEEFVHGAIIIGAHYAGWIALSIVVLVLAGVL